MPKMLPKIKPKVSITISPGLLARVDEEAARYELSRSAVIQVALRKYFEEER